MMIHFTVAEYIVFVMALAVVFLAVRSHIPPWALFIANLGFALYWLVNILDDGPRVMEVLLLTAGVATAVHIWWRDLRDQPTRPS
jgi:hypothetical protein